MKKEKKAFTLSEAIITLIIVGVIAILTVPVLLTKYQDKIYVEKFKKLYTTLYDAFNAAINAHGDISYWNFNEHGSSSKFAGYLAPYLGIMKTCTRGEKCLANNMKTLNNKPLDSSYELSNDYYKMILLDGTVLWIKQHSDDYNNCAGTEGGNSNVCASIYADVSGKKGPNKVSKDIFKVYVVPEGIKADKSDDCHEDDEGWGCADYILGNENSDYPEKARNTGSHGKSDNTENNSPGEKTETSGSSGNIHDDNYDKPDLNYDKPDISYDNPNDYDKPDNDTNDNLDNKNNTNINNNDKNQNIGCDSCKLEKVITDVGTLGICYLLHCIDCSSQCNK